MSRSAGSFQKVLVIGAWVSVGVVTIPPQMVRPAVEETYRNPILFADYSDPDVIRDGANYYLISSSLVSYARDSHIAVHRLSALDYRGPRGAAPGDGPELQHDWR